MTNDYPTSSAPSSLATKGKGRKRGKGFFILMIVVVVVVIGVVIAHLMGYLQVIIKQPTEMVLVRSVVCDSSIVNEYNTASRVIVSSSDERKEYVKGISAVANKVKGLPEYQQDPTCLYILYSESVLNNDITMAKGYYDQLRPLVESGNFVDTRLDNLLGLDAMKGRLEAADNALGSG